MNAIGPNSIEIPSESELILRSMERMVEVARRNAHEQAEQGARGRYTGPGEEDERDPKWLASYRKEG